MELNFLDDILPINTKPSVATIGFFDGFHLGHQFLLSKLKEFGEENNQTTCVVTFGNHPKSLFSPIAIPKLLSTSIEKRSLVKNFGIDNCFVLKFDMSLARLTAKEFLGILKRRICLKTLFVGYDHTFGSDKISDFATINDICKSLDIKAIKVPSLVKDDVVVSSSSIRQLLSKSDVEKASSLLGRCYSLEGEVVRGYQNGRRIGFPTANILASSEKLIPQRGVYAVRVFFEEKCFNGMMNIGFRPTLCGKELSLEVHIFDFSKDIYGELLHIEFVKFVRPEIKFNSLESLKNQLVVDKKTILSIFDD